MDTRKPEKFQLGYWYVNNKPLLRKIGIGIIITVVALIWLNFIVQTIGYLINISSTRQALSDLAVNYVNYDAQKQPEEIVVIDSAILSSGAGKSDVFAHIRNPNNYWSASAITYQFVVSGQNISAKTTTLMPGEEKFIVEQDLGMSSTGAISSDVGFKIIDIKWKGIKQNLPEINVVFEDIEYPIVEFSEEATDTSSTYGRVSATAINKSIYGFKDVDVTVLLKSQNLPNAIAITHLRNFLAGESREIEFTWSRKLPFGAETKFITTTDLLDEDNLIIVSSLD